MTLYEYDAFCRSLPATTYVVQWRGAHVWKVGGKVFAIGRGRGDEATITFKATKSHTKCSWRSQACDPHRTLPRAA
jgi:predicted DNA-binding protein (MmcQ/YjbR family)